MNGNAWQAERARVRKVLKSRIGDPATCFEAIDAYEQLLKSVWEFNAKLLGHGGARAVLARAISVSSRQEGLLRKIAAGESGPDFADLRLHVDVAGCEIAEIIAAFLALGDGLVVTLADLTGDLLLNPLARHLEQRPA